MHTKSLLTRLERLESTAARGESEILIRTDGTRLAVPDALAYLAEHGREGIAGFEHPEGKADAVSESLYEFIDEIIAGHTEWP